MPSLEEDDVFLKRRQRVDSVQTALGMARSNLLAIKGLFLTIPL
jgi:hypothetical protein